MTIEEYEMKFNDELRENQPAYKCWPIWVKECYQSFMDSVAEQELNMELNQL
ncbi:hypothetical protein VPHK392_0004 [Vibrio phage K392]